MTSPPQPHPRIDDNLDIGVTGPQVPVANERRRAANQRQREAAEAAANYDRWRAAMREQVWGREPP
jgi:hypothetical protein